MKNYIFNSVLLIVASTLLGACSNTSTSKTQYKPSSTIIGNSSYLSESKHWKRANNDSFITKRGLANPKNYHKSINKLQIVADRTYCHKQQIILAFAPEIKKKVPSADFSENPVGTMKLYLLALPDEYKNQLWSKISYNSAKVMFNCMMEKGYKYQEILKADLRHSQ